MNTQRICVRTLKVSNLPVSVFLSDAYARADKVKVLHPAGFQALETTDNLYKLTRKPTPTEVELAKRLLAKHQPSLRYVIVARMANCKNPKTRVCPCGNLADRVSGSGVSCKRCDEWDRNFLYKAASGTRNMSTSNKFSKAYANHTPR
jgi:hypothetical protein